MEEPPKTSELNAKTRQLVLKRKCKVAGIRATKVVAAIEVEMLELEATAAATVIEEVIATEVVTEVVSEEATEVATEEVEGVSSKALMFPQLLKGRHLNCILIISGSALEMFQGTFSYIRLILALLTRRTASLSSEASDLISREFSSSI
jgi:hypothetical protein